MGETCTTTYRGKEAARFSVVFIVKIVTWSTYLSKRWYTLFQCNTLRMTFVMDYRHQWMVRLKLWSTWNWHPLKSPLGHTDATKSAQLSRDKSRRVETKQKDSQGTNSDGKPQHRFCRLVRKRLFFNGLVYVFVVFRIQNVNRLHTTFVEFLLVLRSSFFDGLLEKVMSLTWGNK